MKCLFAGSSRERGGAEAHFVTLASALADAGHDVTAVVYPRTPLALALHGSAVACVSGPFRNACDMRGYHAVIRQILRDRPDWLVGDFGREYWPLLLIGGVTRVPVALFRHRIKPMKRLSAYWVPRLADRFFAVSDYARRDYVARGYPADCVQVLHNPVDMHRYRPQPDRGEQLRSELGIEQGATVLGFVGRMLQGKGIFTLLEAGNAAVARCPDLHLLWLGDGPDMAELRARIMAGPHAGHHHLIGHVADPSGYYSAMDMLAMPSTMRETFGRVLIEAQACGVPVMASDAFGMREAVADGVGGMLVEPGSVPAWQEAIEALCEPARRQALGDQARAFVIERFGNEVVAERFVELLQAA